MTDRPLPPAFTVGGVPEPDGTQPMSAAEVRMVRTFLGLSQDHLAALIGTDVRTVKRWESGYYPVPDRRREQIEALEDKAADQVGAIVAALHNAADVTLTLPREPMPPYPQGWWMQIAARVAQEVPGLYVDYARLP